MDESIATDTTESGRSENEIKCGRLLPLDSMILQCHGLSLPVLIPLEKMNNCVKSCLEFGIKHHRLALDMSAGTKHQRNVHRSGRLLTKRIGDDIIASPSKLRKVFHHMSSRHSLDTHNKCVYLGFL